MVIRTSRNVLNVCLPKAENILNAYQKLSNNILCEVKLVEIRIRNKQIKLKIYFW